jgi:hypothetical protein
MSWRPSRESARVISAGALITLVIGLSGVSAWATLQSYTARHLAISSDDVAVMEWLKTHRTRDELVVNDLMADAGIWIPHKAGVPVLVPRQLIDTLGSDLELVHANVGHLRDVPAARATACAHGVTYVYRGAAAPQIFPGVSPWLIRQFPPIDELRRSRELTVVFRSGDAALFRVDLDCRDSSTEWASS